MPRAHCLSYFPDYSAIINDTRFATLNGTVLLKINFRIVLRMSNKMLMADCE